MGFLIELDPLEFRQAGSVEFGDFVAGQRLNIKKKSKLIIYKLELFS